MESEPDNYSYDDDDDRDSGENVEPSVIDKRETGIKIPDSNQPVKDAVIEDPNEHQEDEDDYTTGHNNQNFGKNNDNRV